jgi:hypothetical protein
LLALTSIVDRLAPASIFISHDHQSPTQDIGTSSLLSIVMSLPEASSQSPDEMVNFTLLSPAAAPILAPRLGNLAVAGRKAIPTPNYIPLTSRGAVPHIAHDVMRDQSAIGSLFIGLEDCRFMSTLTCVKQGK